MQTILLILGKESSEFARGNYNQGFFDAARETLEPHFEILTTVVENGYDPAEEIEKFKRADRVIFQYPVFWFMMPSSLKKYIDEVYAYGAFFGFSDGPYGSGGLMTGKKFMLSTTWNAPEHAFSNPDAFYEGMSRDQVLTGMRKTQQFCGLEELPHFSCHDIIHAPDFERDRKRLTAHLAEVFVGDGKTSLEVLS